jgi:hypothetical protein
VCSLHTHLNTDIVYCTSPGFALPVRLGVGQRQAPNEPIFEPHATHPGGLDSAGLTPASGHHTTPTHSSELHSIPATAGGLPHPVAGSAVSHDSMEPGQGPGYNTKTGGLAPMDAGTHPHNSWAGTKDTHPGRGTGDTDPRRGASGVVGTGGFTVEGKETVGHKIKKAISGQQLGRGSYQLMHLLSLS